MTAMVRTLEAGGDRFPQRPDLSTLAMDVVRALCIRAEVTTTPAAEFGWSGIRGIRFNHAQDHRAAVAATERTTVLSDRRQG